MYIIILSSLLGKNPCFPYVGKAKRPKGGQKMNSYELMYILDNDLQDEKKSALTEKFSNLIVSLGGTILSDKKLGTKKYAYLINFKSEGFYVVVDFTISGDQVAEIERQLRITDGVVRHMVIRK